MDEIKQLSRQLKNLETMEENQVFYLIKLESKAFLRRSYSSISTESFLNFVRLRDSLPNLPEVALRSNDNYHGFLELLSQFVEVIERRICTHEGGL
ncbi:hypothetical protein WUBG_05165, partial [Wuchereria bancrofti]